MEAQHQDSEDHSGQFIHPGRDVPDPTSPEWSRHARMSREEIKSRWSSDEGRKLLKELRDGCFARGSIEDHIGKFAGRIDLRGIPLQGLNLSGKNLSDADLFLANLEGCKFDKGDLHGSSLSEANIKSTSFDWCKMKDVTLDNADYNTSTSMIGVDLNTVNFTLAELLREHLSIEQRIDHLKRRHPRFAQFLWITSDYGRSFGIYSFWVLLLIIMYAVGYWVFGLLSNSNGFLDSLYFSVVTFATVGYGDILPSGLVGRLVVISEIALGYLMGGLLIAILGRRVVS